MDEVMLKRDGFWTREWFRDRRKDVTAKLPLDLRFFEAWNTPFTIQGRVRFKDVVSILKQMDAQALSVLAMITGANLPAYLSEDLVPVRDPDRSSRLRFIEVSKYYQVDNQALDHWKMETSVTACGVGEKERDDKNPRAGSFALTYTDWKYLLNLPIRLCPTAQHCTTKWKKARRHVIARSMNGKPLFWSSVAGDGKPRILQTRATYSLGDFFNGLFDDLCFNWTPADRDAFLKLVLQQREPYPGEGKVGTKSKRSLKDSD